MSLVLFALRHLWAAVGRSGAADIPARIGPCEFGQLSNWITVRCPRELAPLCVRPAVSGSPAAAGG